MNKLYSLFFAFLMFFGLSLFATESINSSDANVTFTVNTQNITVGENGMYLGGGVFGGAQAHAMSDDDGDGTWEVTVEMETGTTGNYIFLNSVYSKKSPGSRIKCNLIIGVLMP